MPTIAERSLHEQLVERRQRLVSVTAVRESAELGRLLGEVDAALERIASGAFGACQRCGDPVEGRRLLADPTARRCLACLTPEERADLERDLELAGDVQEALLPERDLAWRGWEIHYHYEPLGAVSGDHCDLAPARDGADERMFLFGDVSGKGVAASIVMSHLQALFRSLLQLELPLDELVTRANRLLCQTTLPSSFATLVVGRLGGGGEVELCNAGHCPPLVVARGAVTPLPATGMPLGLAPDADFGLHRARLAPEDRLFLFTDGLSEAEDGLGGEYGWERLAPVLLASRGRSARATTRACLADLAAFRNGAPRRDDLTLMTLRRTASP